MNLRIYAHMRATLFDPVCLIVLAGYLSGHYVDCGVCSGGQGSSTS